MGWRNLCFFGSGEEGGGRVEWSGICFYTEKNTIEPRNSQLNFTNNIQKYTSLWVKTKEWYFFMDIKHNIQQPSLFLFNKYDVYIGSYTLKRALMYFKHYSSLRSHHINCIRGHALREKKNKVKWIQRKIDKAVRLIPNIIIFSWFPLLSMELYTTMKMGEFHFLHKICARFRTSQKF